MKGFLKKQYFHLLPQRIKTVVALVSDSVIATVTQLVLLSFNKDKETVASNYVNIMSK